MATRSKRKCDDDPIIIETETDCVTTSEKSDISFDIDDETNNLAQVIAKRIIKETKRHKPSARNTNYAEQCLQLKKVNNSLTISFKVIEDEIKKLKKNINCNSTMINLINNDIQWTTITDISKKGRGLYIHYTDSDNIEYMTKIQEYNKMKNEEKTKHESNEYVTSANVMSKIIGIYTNKNNTEVTKETMLLDALDVIIRDHKTSKSLFANNKDFYSNYDFEEEEEEKDEEKDEEEDEEEEEEDEEEEEEEEEDDEEDDEEDEEEK